MVLSTSFSTRKCLTIEFEGCWPSCLAEADLPVQRLSPNDSPVHARLGLNFFPLITHQWPKQWTSSPWRRCRTRSLPVPWATSQSALHPTRFRKWQNIPCKEWWWTPFYAWGVGRGFIGCTTWNMASEGMHHAVRTRGSWHPADILVNAAALPTAVPPISDG